MLPLRKRGIKEGSMSNAISSHDFLLPVLKRARAKTPKYGLFDRAAFYVIKHLGALDHQEEAINPRSACIEIEKCSWIDKRLVSFFKQNPLAEGIEINSGLSTRFHRISEQLEWPEFSWKSINDLAIHDCFKDIFPEIDNFASIASPCPDSQWHQHVSWQAQGAVIIAGERHPTTSWSELSEMIYKIQQLLPDNVHNIDLIMGHRLPNLARECGKRLNAVEILSQTKDTTAPFPRLTKLLRFLHSPKDQVAHLRISKEKVSHL